MVLNMKIVAHISDLHFGTEDLNAERSLIQDLNELKPSLLVVSGDLTQRARRKQFIKARSYLEKLPKPQLVIPGNHDIPLFDIFRRIFSPLRRFKKYISSDLTPLYRDDELAVLGVNTARPYKWKNGEISREQIALVKEKMCDIPGDCFKIVVTHHPFIPPPKDDLIDLVDKAQLAVDVLDPCGIDLLLAGHLHHGYTGDIRKHYPSSARSIIAAQAGTAISDRIRGEQNSYNLIYIDKNRFEISVRVFEKTGFAEKVRVRYEYKEGQWVQNDQIILNS